MPFQVGIGSLGGTMCFQVGLCTPLQTMTVCTTLKGGLRRTQKLHNISAVNNCQTLAMTDYLQALVEQMKFREMSKKKKSFKCSSQLI